jgi:hypothetical protein
MIGGSLAAAIDPEKLAGHTHYVRNFRLLELARGAVMLAMFGSVVIAWFASCLLLLNSKHQPYGWLLLAFLGPIGLVCLTALRDLTPDPTDLYERLIRKLNWFFRAVYEIAFLMLAWTLAWEMMLLKREGTIFLQSVMTGASRQQILDEQNASSGMWAFGELLDVIYFFALLYLVRPVCVNLVGRLARRRPPAPV